MLSKLQTTRLTTSEERQAFFERLSDGYTDQHGNVDRLLAYRVSLIERMLSDIPDMGGQCVMELGCGPADHLIAIASRYPLSRAIGTDFSPGMVREAQRKLREAGIVRSEARVAAAEDLDGIETESMDIVFTVGAIEHMPDKLQVLRSVSRVLKPGGRFVCLTVNGRYLWQTLFGNRLGLGTRHISTDSFLRREEVPPLAESAGLVVRAIGHWRFVPAGDMAAFLAVIFRALDRIGALLSIHSLRGGLYFSCDKPQ